MLRFFTFNNSGLEKFINLLMLFQLNDTSKANIDKLLAFAKQNQLHLSLVDELADNLFLPGKALTPDKLMQMIEKSRKSGIIPMTEAHQIIRDKY